LFVKFIFLCRPRVKGHVHSLLLNIMKYNGNGSKFHLLIKQFARCLFLYDPTSGLRVCLRINPITASILTFFVTANGGTEWLPWLGFNVTTSHAKYFRKQTTSEGVLYWWWGRWVWGIHIFILLQMSASSLIESRIL